MPFAHKYKTEVGGYKTTTKLPNGEVLELFDTNYLCRALGKDYFIIRRWELCGILPKTCFMRYDTYWRLYSQEQIKAIVENFEKYYVGKTYSISRTLFPKKCHEAFATLQKKYLGGTNSEKS